MSNDVVNLDVTCSLCNKRFSTTNHLRRHRRTVHDASNNRTCASCGRIFNRSDSYKRHLLTHDRPVPESPQAATPRAKRRYRRRQRYATCASCAGAHVECPGLLPCPRCRQNGLQCTPLLTPSTGFKSPLSAGNGLSNPGNSLSQAGHTSADRAYNVDHQLTSQLNWLPVINPELVIDQTSADLTTGQHDDSSSSAEADLPPVNSPALDLNSPGQHSSFGPSASVPNTGWTGHGRVSRDLQQQRVSRHIDLGESLLKAPSEAHGDDRVRVFSFPKSNSAPNQTRVAETVSSQSYSILSHMFALLAGKNNLVFRSFQTSYFPSRQYLDGCVAAFMKTACEDVPVIHPTSWHENTSWLLVLAVCTVGAIPYSANEHGRTAFGFQELLRRSIRYVIETGSINDPLILCQASLLNAFAAIALYKTSSFEVETAMAELQLLTCRLHTIESDRLATAVAEMNQSPRWSSWIVEETRQRLLFFSWQLSFNRCMEGAVQSSSEPGPLSLPCAHSLWNAESDIAWAAVYEGTQHPLRMDETLQALYKSRQIPQNLDHQGLIAAIYGVVARTLHVGEQLRHPTNRWMPQPSTNQDRDSETSNEQVEWLPANSIYSSWRNSACDCLDLIHWKAQVEMIAAGTEHETSTMLHLHLARLVILAPFKEIIRFASSAVKSYSSGRGQLPLDTTARGQNPQDNQQTRTAIMRWLTMDDHKGRLAVIHAGRLFWHIRRFSRNSVYEPFAIFLASLVLWTYALYQPQVHSLLIANKAAMPQRNLHREGNGSQSESESDDPTSVLIDRPCDDEIVQLFIRKGHVMEPRMFGNVPICAANGSSRVVREGAKLLFNCCQSSYTKAHEYQAALVGLIQ